MSRRYWTGLAVLLVASVGSFLGSRYRLAQGDCDTVWECADAGVLLTIALALALVTVIYAFIGAVRADRKRTRPE